VENVTLKRPASKLVTYSRSLRANVTTTPWSQLLVTLSRRFERNRHDALVRKTDPVPAGEVLLVEFLGAMRGLACRLARVECDRG
jgi:hypothetical protein